MLKKFLLVLALFVSLLQLSGCASIVSSSKTTLPIITQPDEATCEITDMKSGIMITKTKTPHTALLDASAGFFQRAKYNIKLSKEGYLPYETQLNASMNGWYLGNIVFGGALGILIIDPATGAMWKIYEDNINVKLYKDSPEGRVSMATEKYNGLEAYKNADYDQAIQDTTKGIAIYPEFHEGYSIRGSSYAAKGEFDMALADINKAIGLKPDSPNAYKDRAEVYLKQSKNDKAMADFEKAIAIKPDYAEALFSRGYYYQSINNKEQAKADITAACKNGFQRACNFSFSTIN